MTRPMPGPPEDCYCRFGNATCQECETRGYPYSWGLCPGCLLHNGRDLGAHKRLKDAECAAHYWQADGECLALDNALIVGWSNHETVTNADTRAETWKRFMDTTHALEEA